MSKASDDLPDPLTPVVMMSAPTGRDTSIFLRLCVRAPRMTISDRSAAAAGGATTAELVVSDIACLGSLSGQLRRGVKPSIVARVKIFRSASIPSERGDADTFTGAVTRATLASDEAGTPVNAYRVAS